MSRPRAFLLAVPLVLSAPAAAAGTLYRCDGPSGSIAYTSDREGFRNCTVIQVTQATPAPSPAAAAAAAPGPGGAPANAAPGWDYRENVVDFGNVQARVATHPARIARHDFGLVRGGLASTAPLWSAPDFSTVHADVRSTARTVGNPLFVAPPWRPPAASGAGGAAAGSPGVAALPAATPAREPAPRVLRGAVYKVARADGITEYTNVRPAGGGQVAVLFTYIATCFACDTRSAVDFARTALNLDAYRNEIAAAAAEFGVDRALLRAVIHAESAFNPMAVSSKGAQGLMQLMPGTAGDLGVTDAFDVIQNIRGGSRYLAQLLASFQGDVRLAAAAYNAGPGAVQRHGGIPPYDETRVYVQRVETLRERYAQAL